MQGSAVENMEKWGFGEAGVTPEWREAQNIIPFRLDAISTAVERGVVGVTREMVGLVVSMGDGLESLITTKMTELLPKIQDLSAIDFLIDMYGVVDVANYEDPALAKLAVIEFMRLGQYEARSKTDVITTASLAEAATIRELSRFRQAIALFFADAIKKIEEKLVLYRQADTETATIAQETPEVSGLAAHFKPQFEVKINELTHQKATLEKLAAEIFEVLDGGVKADLTRTIFSASQETDALTRQAA